MCAFWSLSLRGFGMETGSGTVTLVSSPRPSSLKSSRPHWLESCVTMVTTFSTSRRMYSKWLSFPETCGPAVTSPAWICASGRNAAMVVGRRVSPMPSLHTSGTDGMRNSVILTDSAQRTPDRRSTYKRTLKTTTSQHLKQPSQRYRAR
ncbi:unnamed protein product [Staurois parvus]|uniref:Secreted protein n=1 Tax=Staurois parvus TaxID=386267 RepID=A0ABN9GUD1_9NEOB|nr:unnamed protein product [Staurois parvus]